MSVADQTLRANGTVSERIYGELRDMIESGKLKPGMRLVQRDLAEQLKTSNIPIVEAIRRLEHDGLVVSMPNCGAQVIDWSVDEMECAIMVRSSLEQVAARLCAVRATDEQREKLRHLDQKFSEYAAAGDVAECRATDTALHALIVKCSGSRLLIRMLNNSRVITNTIRNLTWLPVVVSRPNIHSALIEAIVSGNEEQAETEAKLHIEDLLSRVRQAVSSRGLRP